MMFKCIEAPCCYQDPQPELQLLPGGDFECPYCKQVYSRKLLDRIHGMTPCIGGDDECHLLCCNEPCEGDGCANCGPDV